MVQQRLGQPAPGEARITAPETPEAVHGIIEYIDVVTDSKRTRSACHPPSTKYPSLQMVIHQSVVSRKLAVYFVSNSRLVLCLTEL